jgi:hypothetical protein
LDPGFPVVPVGPWTFFVAALDKVQYDYHPHAAQPALAKICLILLNINHRKMNILSQLFVITLSLKARKT